MEKDIRKYWGYLHHDKGRPLSCLGLHSFSDLDVFFDYLERIQATSTLTEMQKQATLATKVTTFMANLSRSHGEKASARRFMETVEHLGYLTKEISGNLKRAKGTQTK